MERHRHTAAIQALDLERALPLGGESVPILRGVSFTVIAAATAIALCSAVAVAWRPTHARPLDVLRQE